MNPSATSGLTEKGLTEKSNGAIGERLIDASRRLGQALDLDRTASRIEVEVLLCEALGVSRAYLAAHGADYPDEASSTRFEILLERRLEGEPVAYILGRREFYSQEFMVTPLVLIPRPETEHLVESALALIPEDRSFKVLDLGTGTGAIAITLARHRPRAQVTATDHSEDVLKLARGNAAKLGVTNVRFARGDWFSAVPGQRFDLIVSNPPYISADDPHLQTGDVRFEPRAALVGGWDGLDALSRIIAGAPFYLFPGGWLLFEHGYNQAESCGMLMNKTGFREVSRERDLAGIERITRGQKPEDPQPGHSRGIMSGCLCGEIHREWELDADSQEKT